MAAIVNIFEWPEEDMHYRNNITSGVNGPDAHLLSVFYSAPDPEALAMCDSMRAACVAIRAPAPMLARFPTARRAREKHHACFGTILNAFWWAIVSMTTVGCAVGSLLLRAACNGPPCTVDWRHRSCA